MSDSRIGQLLVHDKFIDRDQLDQAIQAQKHSPGQPLGQLLCKMGFLDNRDLQLVLDRRHKRHKLGEILKSQHLIDEERLKLSLKESQSEHTRLGKVLLRQRIVDEEQLARAIALQHDMKFVRLAELKLSPGLVNFVTPTFAERLGIVPIWCTDKSLTIAMAYPIQREELSQLESWCKMSIISVIAKESEIIQAQQRLFQNVEEPDPAELQLELSEDMEKEGGKSKYVNNFISADVDYLTKRIITTGLKDGISDIHLESNESGVAIRYRMDGILQNISLGADDQLINVNARQIISKLKILCGMDIAERRRPQDSSFKMKVSKDGKVRSVDFRVSTVPTQYGENMVIRVLDKRSGANTLEDLGYPPKEIATLYRALDMPTGIFLVTGPTGSGKSSALYAVLSRINTPGVKTLTIEDPIEFSMDGVTQTEVNDMIGNSFARLLRAFLRQDPDIIMVGEIRDLETANISMRAAMTGHTVLSTMHTNDATSAVTRLIDMGAEPSVISATLRGVLAQRLVRRICPACKAPYQPSAALLREFSIPEEHGLEFFQGRGCPVCNYTGFKGRLPIVELWVPTRDELLLLNHRPDNLALRNVVFAAVQRSTIFDNGFRLVQAGLTTLEELIRTVPYEQIEIGRERLAASLC